MSKMKRVHMSEEHFNFMVFNGFVDLTKYSYLFDYWCVDGNCVCLRAPLSSVARGEFRPQERVIVIALYGE